MNTNVFEEKSFLLSLTLSVWSAKHTDARGTAAVASQYGADTQDDKYVMSLFTGDPLKPIRYWAYKIRNNFYHYTYPWAHGVCLMPIESWESFRQQHTKYKLEFEKAVEEFLDAYNGHIDKAIDKKGTLVDKSRFPSADEVRRKFNVALVTTPFPVSGDFRLDASAEVISDLQSHLDEALDGQIAGVKQAALDKFRDRLLSINDTFENNRNFVISHLNKLDDLCDLFDGNESLFPAEIGTAVTRIRANILPYTADQIRHNEELKARIHQEVTDLLEVLDV